MKRKNERTVIEREANISELFSYASKDLYHEECNTQIWKTLYDKFVMKPYIRDFVLKILFLQIHYFNNRKWEITRSKRNDCCIRKE